MEKLGKTAKDAYVIAKALRSPETYLFHAPNAIKSKALAAFWKNKMIPPLSYELKWALFTSYGNQLRIRGKEKVQEMTWSDWLLLIFHAWDD